MPDNVALTRRFYECVNAGDVDGFLELIDDDFVDHEEFPGLPEGKEGVRAFFTMLRTAFPDLRMDVEDIIEQGDRLAVRVRMSGMQEGEFLGVPPSGRRMDVQAIDIIAVRDGRAVEHWGVTDGLAMMQQLGAIPAPA